MIIITWKIYAEMYEQKVSLERDYKRMNFY